MEKVSIDKDLCIGCGYCAANLDKVFVMDDDNLATTTDIDIEELTSDELNRLHELVDECPVGAIKVED